jgi:hypothetical protein
VSNPASASGDSTPVDDAHSDQPTEGASEPIDVHELLESTRKLFEPEELHRAMEQAGYTPEYPHPSSNNADKLSDLPVAVTSPDGVEHINGEEGVDSVDRGDDATDNSGAQHSDPLGVESAGGYPLTTKPPLRGVNVLSVVAFVLAFTLSPLAVIFGYIALGQTRRASQRGETLALWAIGVGWLVFAAWVVVIASLVWIAYQQGITVDSLREFIELFSLP